MYIVFFFDVTLVTFLTGNLGAHRKSGARKWGVFTGNLGAHRKKILCFLQPAAGEKKGVPPRKSESSRPKVALQEIGKLQKKKL